MALKWSIYGKYKDCTVTKGLDWAEVKASHCRIEVISQGIEKEKEKIERRRFLN